MAIDDDGDKRAEEEDCISSGRLRCKDTATLSWGHRSVAGLAWSLVWNRVTPSVQHLRGAKRTGPGGQHNSSLKQNCLGRESQDVSASMWWPSLGCFTVQVKKKEHEGRALPSLWHCPEQEAPRGAASRGQRGC